MYLQSVPKLTFNFHLTQLINRGKKCIAKLSEKLEAQGRDFVRASRVGVPARRTNMLEQNHGPEVNPILRSYRSSGS